MKKFKIFIIDYLNAHLREVPEAAPDLMGNLVQTRIRIRIRGWVRVLIVARCSPLQQRHHHLHSERGGHESQARSGHRALLVHGPVSLAVAGSDDVIAEVASQRSRDRGTDRAVPLLHD